MCRAEFKFVHLVTEHITQRALSDGKAGLQLDRPFETGNGPTQDRRPRCRQCHIVKRLRENRGRKWVASTKCIHRIVVTAQGK